MQKGLLLFFAVVALFSLTADAVYSPVDIGDRLLGPFNAENVHSFFFFLFFFSFSLSFY